MKLSAGRGTSSQKIICLKGGNQDNSIEFLGSSSEKQNLAVPSNPKTLKTGYILGFTRGDVILFRCCSGDYTTISTDSPVSTINYQVEFMECTDDDGTNYPVVTIDDQTWMAENLAYLPKVDPSSAGSFNWDKMIGYLGAEAGGKIKEPGYGNVLSFRTLEGGYFMDSRDSKPYNYVKIGNQFWMAENLVFLPALSKPATNSGSVPHYYVYGYTGESVSGLNDNNGQNGNGDNAYGFSALPGGDMEPTGYFLNLGDCGSFWTADPDEGFNSLLWLLDKFNRGAFSHSYPKNMGFSVRCIKN